MRPRITDQTRNDAHDVSQNSSRNKMRSCYRICYRTRWDDPGKKRMRNAGTLKECPRIRWFGDRPGWTVTAVNESRVRCFRLGCFIFSGHSQRRWDPTPTWDHRRVAGEKSPSEAGSLLSAAGPARWATSSWWFFFGGSFRRSHSVFGSTGGPQNTRGCGLWPRNASRIGTSAPFREPG